MLKISRDSLPRQLLDAERIADVIWNASSEKIPECMQAIREGIKNQIFSLTTMMDILSTVSIYRPHSFNCLCQLGIAIKNEYNIENIFIKAPALKSKIRSTDNPSLELYGPNTIGATLLNDRVEVLQKMFSNPVFDSDVCYRVENTVVTEILHFNDIAAKYGSVSCFKFLQLNNFNATETTLKNALYGGNAEIIHLILPKFTVNDQCLQDAVTAYRNDIAEWLLENYTINRDWSSMLSNYNFTFFINTLCECERFDKLDNKKDNPLLASCKIDIFWLSKFLLERTEDVNHYNNAKSNAIIYASMGTNVDLVNLLLDNGADINSKSQHDATPLLVAFMNQRREIVSLLLERGAELARSDNDTIWASAILRNDVDLVSTLLARGIDPNTEFMEDKNALLHCVEHSQLEMIDLLLEYNIDVNVKSSMGYTPLMTAVMYGKMDIAEKLINKGAKVDDTDDFGDTVMNLASEEDKEKLKSIIENSKKLLQK